MQQSVLWAYALSGVFDSWIEVDATVNFCLMHETYKL